MKKLVLLVTIFTLVFINFGNAQTGIPKAQSMFIYNFSRLIQWPASYSSGDFVVGVFGNSTVFNELESFTAGKKVGNQSFSIVKFRDVSEISKCNILFVSFGKSGDIGAITSKLAGQSTLIISEKNGGIEDGSAINFVVESDKLKFEMKPSNALKYDLKVSSTLSNMAMLVE